MAGYAKQRATWQDFPVTSTPILATNLNALEQAIYDAKHRVFNVAEDYGLTGTAIANAFADAATAGGGVVELNAGVGWTLASQIVFPLLSPGYGVVILRGQGMRSTSLGYTGSGYAFQFGNGTNLANGHRIEDLRVDMSGSATPTGAVNLRNADNCELERVEIVGPTGGTKVLVNFDNTSGTETNYFNKIRHCRIQGQTQASDVGVKLFSSGGNGANSNYVRDNWFGTFNQAVLIDGGDTNRVDGNEFNGSINTGVRLQTANTVRNRITDNQFDPGGVTWSIDISTATVDGTMVAFNTGGGGINNNGSNTKLAFNELAVTDGGGVSNIIRFDGTLIRNPVGGAALLSGLRLGNHLNKTAAYAMTATDTVVRADATGGIFTVTLPSASAGAIGQLVHIKKIDTSANAVTVARAGSDTIDGATTVSLAARGNSVTLLGDGGTTWLKVAST